MGTEVQSGMRRRDYLNFATASALAMRISGSSVSAAGRFRPAVCAYSFRNRLKDKTMSYGDLIRMTADLGAQGVDPTTYWLADTDDEPLFALKQLA